MYKRIRYGGIKGKPSNYSEFIIDNEEDLSLIPIENDECSIGSLAYSNKKVFILYPSGWFEFNNDVKNIANKYYENLLTKYILRDFDEELVIDSETIGNYAGAPIKSVIAENALNIIDYAFYNCINLTNINIPNIINISDGAFNGCISLKDASFPNATNIDSAAFYGCTSLTDVNLPNLAEINAEGAFSNCTSLTDLTFSNLTKIYKNTFIGCNLTNLRLPKITSFDSNAIGWDLDCVIENLYLDGIITLPAKSITNVKNVYLENCTTLKTNSFYSKNRLIYVYIPKVTKLEKTAFNGCSNLESIDLPSATSLGTTVFNLCSKLKLINASAIKSIAATSLKSIPSLESIYLKSCTTIAKNSFSGNTNLLDIYLPNASNTYSNAPWGAVNATIHYECEFNEDGIPLEVLEEEQEGE